MSPAERLRAMPDADVDLDQLRKVLLSAFGTESLRDGFLRAHDALLNPVVSPAERERLRAIMADGLRLLSAYYDGNVTRLAESIGVSRPTIHAMREHCAPPKP